MAEQSIFESKAAAAGKNEKEFPIPSEHTSAVKWVVQRLSKLTNERRMTAEKISDIRLDAKADGIPAEELTEAMRLGKMTAERRTKYVEARKYALRLHGFQIEIADEDLPKDEHWKKLQKHLQALKMYGEQRAEISAEIRDLTAAAKARGMNVPVLKQIIKLSKLDEEDRAEWFAQTDNMGAIMGYW